MNYRILLPALALPLLSACGAPRDTSKAEIPAELETLSIATFAGGCFWCMEPPFEVLDGVEAVYSGYTGGPEVDPDYEEVAYGRTGHTEAVRVFYDPETITYEELLDVYWRQINPTDAGGQFADRGSQYRPEIFVHSPEQRKVAEQSKKALEESGRFEKPIVVSITEAGQFYPAEEYHQDYHRKNPAHYKSYKRGSGREYFLKQNWSNGK